MSTSFRLLRTPLCDICRDQVYDFAWVTIVQLLVLLAGGINGFMFAIEEVLLFFVLVIVKHRIPPPWEDSK
jgi:hypothetical protein